MSSRTANANKAIALRWSQEQQLVSTGQGTRDWTQEQQRDILDRGKAYDDNGKAFEGHHMKSVERYPEYQSDPGNIQFLSRSEHCAAHDGNFQNYTNGYFNPFTGETTDFGGDKYEPCVVINLSEPTITDYHTTRYEESAISTEEANLDPVAPSIACQTSKMGTPLYTQKRPSSASDGHPATKGGLRKRFKRIVSSVKEFSVRHPVLTRLCRQ